MQRGVHYKQEFVQSKAAKVTPRRSVSPPRLAESSQQINATPFEGDFFGNDYAEADFPFPAGDMPEIPAELPVVDEASDDSVSEDDEPGPASYDSGMEESDTGSTGGEINSAMDIDIQPAAAAPATRTVHGGHSHYRRSDDSNGASCKLSYSRAACCARRCFGPGP